MRKADYVASVRAIVPRGFVLAGWWMRAGGAESLDSSADDRREQALFRPMCGIIYLTVLEEMRDAAAW